MNANLLVFKLKIEERRSGSCKNNGFTGAGREMKTADVENVCMSVSDCAAAKDGLSTMTAGSLSCSCCRLPTVRDMLRSMHVLLLLSIYIMCSHEEKHAGKD